MTVAVARPLVHGPLVHGSAAPRVRRMRQPGCQPASSAASPEHGQRPGGRGGVAGRRGLQRRALVSLPPLWAHTPRVSCRSCSTPSDVPCLSPCMTALRLQPRVRGAWREGKAHCCVPPRSTLSPPVSRAFFFSRAGGAFFSRARPPLLPGRRTRTYQHTGTTTDSATCVPSNLLDETALL